MPEAATNAYKVDRRAIEFTLYEHLHVEQLLSTSATRTSRARGSATRSSTSARAS